VARTGCPGDNVIVSPGTEYVRNPMEYVAYVAGVRNFAARSPYARLGREKDVYESWNGNRSNVSGVGHEKSPGAEAPGRFPVSSAGRTGSTSLPVRHRSAGSRRT